MLKRLQPVTAQVIQFSQCSLENCLCNNLSGFFEYVCEEEKTITFGGGGGGGGVM